MWLKYVVFCHQVVLFCDARRKSYYILDFRYPCKSKWLESPFSGPQGKYYDSLEATHIFTIFMRIVVIYDYLCHYNNRAPADLYGPMTVSFSFFHLRKMFKISRSPLNEPPFCSATRFILLVSIEERERVSHSIVSEKMQDPWPFFGVVLKNDFVCMFAARPIIANFPKKYSLSVVLLKSISFVSTAQFWTKK